RRKRSSSPALPLSSVRRTLMAKSRWRASSAQRYTSPMPPTPMRSKNTWPDASRVIVASVSAESVGLVVWFESESEFFSDIATPPPTLRKRIEWLAINTSYQRIRESERLFRPAWLVQSSRAVAAGECSDKLSEQSGGRGGG